MILSNQRTINISRDYECTAAELFRQLRPENMLSWWTNLKEATLPSKVGEKVLLKWHGFDGSVKGEITEYVPNKTLAFTWESSTAPDVSNVRFTVEDTPEGSRLNLVHDNNKDFAEAADHDHGWTYCLDHLSKAVNKKPRDKAVHLKRTLNAPVEMVFEAWTNPEHIVCWMNDDFDSKAVCEVQLKVGGDFRIDHIDTQGRVHCHYGTYKVVDRPNKLVFTWLSDHTQGETEVMVDLRSNGDKTEIELTHRLFSGEKEAKDHEDGWQSCWSTMDKLLAR